MNQPNECVPARKQNGEIASKTYGPMIARRALIAREGQPPFPKAVCRHLCDNDSVARNGFVCTLHTTWGTHRENMQDKSPEMRSKPMKVAGKIINASPDHNTRTLSTCPHCGKTGQTFVMKRHHFDNCKWRTDEQSCPNS